MQAVASLNPTQVHLLKMFSVNTSELFLKQLKKVLFDFYCKQVECKGTELAKTMNLTDEKLEAMSNEHDCIWDNKFVDCAITAGATYIVSNDKHFDILKQIPFPKVDVKTLREFKEILKLQKYK